MKIRINRDERFPVYSICDPDQGGKECEVSKETLARWKRIEREFEKIQQEMVRAFYNAIEKV